MGTPAKMMTEIDSFERTYVDSTQNVFPQGEY